MTAILPFLIAFSLLFAAGCKQQKSPGTNPPLVQFGEKHRLHSKILNEDREYWVYLPPSYESIPDHAPQKYPVLYVLDGDWNFAWGCQVAQFLGDSLEIPELIVVGIPNTDRQRDLTPTHIVTDADSGGGPQFEKFLTEEVVPEIDSKFRTAPYRILMGHSLGGAFATDSFLRQGTNFQAYIAIDPSLWWDNRVLVERAKEFSPRTNSHDAIFIAEANWPHNLADATNSNKYASDLFLSALNTNSPTHIRIGWRFLEVEDHSSSRLLGLYDGLRFIFQDYKTNIYAFNTPELIEGHFKKISDQLGFQILPSEAYVNKIAEVYLNPSNADRAIECFKLNVTNYPDSASVYRHLGDAYSAKGEKDLAIENYKKALQLDPNMDTAKEGLKKLK